MTTKWYLGITLLFTVGTAVAVENMLTDAERDDGWKLLFDGISIEGWRNYRATGLLPGWR